MTDSKEDGLLACPFCNGSADFCETSVWWVRCNECGADAESHETKSGAIALWNRRASSQPVGADADGWIHTTIRNSEGVVGTISTRGTSDIESVPFTTDVREKAVSSPPVGGSGEVVVKPLGWREYEYAAAPSAWEANSMLGWYTVRYFSSGWCWRTRFFDQNGDTGRDHFYSADEAKAAAQADYEKRIRSALASPVPNGVPEGDAWRDLALQFDGHRIEALSFLRYLSEASNAAEAVGRIGEIKAFLANPPLSGEAVLAQRLAASPVTPEGLSGGDERVPGDVRGWKFADPEI